MGLKILPQHTNLMITFIRRNNCTCKRKNEFLWYQLGQSIFGFFSVGYGDVALVALWMCISIIIMFALPYYRSTRGSITKLFTWGHRSRFVQILKNGCNIWLDIITIQSTIHYYFGSPLKIMNGINYLSPFFIMQNFTVKWSFSLPPVFTVRWPLFFQ